LLYFQAVNAINQLALICMMKRSEHSFWATRYIAFCWLLALQHIYTRGT